MKLCKDCSYFEPTGMYSASCWRDGRKVEPVYGKLDFTNGAPFWCSKERDSNNADACGPDGKFWQHNDTAPKPIKELK